MHDLAKPTRTKLATVTVQFEVAYDSTYLDLDEVVADLRRDFGRTPPQEQRPYRHPDGAKWWTHRTQIAAKNDRA